MKPMAIQKAAVQLAGFMAAMLLALCLTLTPFAAEKPQQVVRVGWFPYPGYQEAFGAGQYSGYNYDYLMRIAQETGWKYEFVNASWDDCLSMLESGEIDLMGSLLWSEERAAKYAYPEFDCGLSYTSLCVREDSSILENSFADFDGMRIAGMGQIRNWRDLATFAGENSFTFSRIPCSSISASIEMVLANDADGVIFGGFPDQEGLRVVARFAPSSSYFATGKGNDEILSQLNRALEAISLENPYFDSQLSARYEQRHRSTLFFTTAEQRYLESAPILRVLCSGDWAPLESFDENTGEFSGMVAGVFEEISRSTGLKFEFIPSNHGETIQQLENGEADLVASFEGTQDNAARLGLVLSSSYFSLPMMMISDADATPEVAQIVAGVQQSSFYDVVLFQNYEIRQYPTDADCIRALERGEMGQVVLNGYTANSHLSQGRSRGWQISPLQGLDLDLRIGIMRGTEPTLLSILNKAIGQIDEAQINRIILSNSIHSQENSLVAAINRMPVYVVLIFSGFLLLIILVLSRVIVNRARGEHTINALLYYDSLTGLLNQRGFEKEARRILDNAPKNRCYVISHFDINSFEVYNSLYGFEAGDQLLKTVARVVTADGTEEQPCARLSNDNFVKLTQVQDLDEMLERTRIINDKICEGFQGKSVLISYGLYEITDRSISISSMCDMASTAKRMVKGNYECFIGIYDEALRRRQFEEIRLVSWMEQALKNGEFVPFYQPKYDIRTGRIAGAEALVRWLRPSGEMILPASFVGLFEKNGLIARIDRYIFRRVCAQLAEQKEQGIDVLPVSVNFSRVHLFDANFSRTLELACQEYEISPNLLEIELTESAFVVRSEILSRAIDDLHRVGFLVSMDDFGSGFSSLNMLKDMYFDVVKLDRGFLVETSETARGQKVIESILYLARRLRLKTVAEGVETAEQLALLHAHNCDLAQGYYFSQPVPAGEWVRMLVEQPKQVPEQVIQKEQKHRNRMNEGKEFGISEMRELLDAVSTLYAMVISVNLTRNCYYLVEHNDLLLMEIEQEGRVDDLLEVGAATVHPDDRQNYRDVLSCEALLHAYARGERKLRLMVRQKNSLGYYQKNETWVVFISDQKNHELLALTFSRAIGEEERESQGVVIKNEEWVN